MKKIIIFAAAVCILTMGLFNYLKSPGNNLGDLATKAVTPKILKSQNNKVNEEVAISMDQISFDIVKDNNILDEIKNLDILSMTPLDAMNALFSLQKKVKNK